MITYTDEQIVEMLEDLCEGAGERFAELGVGGLSYLHHNADAHLKIWKPFRYLTLKQIGCGYTIGQADPAITFVFEGDV